MPTTRITYYELPASVRAAIEEVIGPVLSAASTDTGLNSAVAARLSTPTGDRFCKALPADHRWVWTQRREADIAPHLHQVAPDLLARLEVDGWDVLLFDALDGHHADYSPGSPDLPVMVTLLDAISATPCPAIELRDAGERLRNYVTDPADLGYFTGSALLHTDLNNTNVIVGTDRARIVDWGWATRGAPWLDAGYWVIWLIAAGHRPAAAENWAAKVTTWMAAPPREVTAFAAAQAALWAEIGARTLDDAWTQQLVNASRRWSTYRHDAA